MAAKGSVGSTQWEWKPHIDLAALGLVDREPLDEERVGLLEQTRQHGDPPGRHQLAAATERPGDGLDARPIGG